MMKSQLDRNMMTVMTCRLIISALGRQLITREKRHQLSNNITNHQNQYRLPIESTKLGVIKVLGCYLLVMVLLLLIIKISIKVLQTLKSIIQEGALISHQG